MTEPLHNLLEQHFDTAFAAPNGIKKLRELILTLAMQGKLVAQDPNDPPASELLKQIEAEKQRLHASSSSRKRGSSGVKDLDSRLCGNDSIKTKSLPPIKPEEVPYELPQGWEWVRLGDICSYIQRGKGPKYVDLSTHQVISQKCVRWYGLDLEPARYIDPTSLEEYEPIRFLRVGDLLWNSTGTGTIGRACLVPKGLEDVEIVADSHVTVVRIIEVSPLFLWRWIQGPIVQNAVKGSASGTTNQIELNTSTIINHLIPLPPLPEQHRIVAKIDQLMAKCYELEVLRKAREEKRRAVHVAAIKQLLDTTSSFPRMRESSSSQELGPDFLSERGQPCGGDGISVQGWNFIQQHFGELYTVKENVAELRKTILQLAVMGRLVPQDPNDPPASELLKQIEAEKQRLHDSSSSPRKRGSRSFTSLDPRLRGDDGIKTKPMPPIKPEEVPYELPQGWEWVRLGEMIELISGQHLTPGEYNEDRIGYPYYTGPADFGVANPTATRWTKIDRAIALQGDILLTVKGAGVGKTNVLTEEIAAISRQLMALRVIRINRDFVLKFLNTIFYELQALAVGIAIPGINRDDVLLRSFPLPPFPEQHRIVVKIDQLMTLCDRLEQQIDAATGKQTELLDAVMAEV